MRNLAGDRSEDDDVHDDDVTTKCIRRKDESRIKAEIVFEKPKPIVDRIPAKQPKFEKGKGRPLPAQGAR